MTSLLIFLAGLAVGGGFVAFVRQSQPMAAIRHGGVNTDWHTESVGSAFAAPVIIPPMPTQTYAVADDCFLIVSDSGQVTFPLPEQDASDVRAMKQAWAQITANPNGQQWTLYHGHRVRGRVGVVS